MHHFIQNVTLVTSVFILWSGAGLGLSLLLVPRGRKAEGLLLSPLLGMSVLGILGHFQISVLLVPIAPIVNIAFLVFLSVTFCVYQRKNLRNICKHFHSRYSWFFVIPAIYLLSFAAMFDHEGFHLLLGSQDQLQYCLNSQCILEELHTGSALDTPVPRADHYLLDSNTCLMPYLKYYRLGSEILLATMTVAAGSTPVEMFPVTVCAITLTLGLALVFVGRMCLYLNRFACCILQATFLSSFGLVLLHFQGSIACLASYPISVVALAVLARTLYHACWRWVPLSGLLVASTFTFYTEPSFITLIAPCLLLALGRIIVPRTRRLAHVMVMSSVCAIAAACSPYGCYSFFWHTKGNIQATLANLLARHAPTVSGNEPPIHFAAHFTSPFFTQLATVMGFNSYYDLSSFNHRIGSLFHTFPWVGLLFFLGAALFALAGLLFHKNIPCKVFALVLMAWMTTCLIIPLTHDYLRFFRSAQYTLPFIVLGLVVLTFSRSRFSLLRNPLRSILSWSGGSMLLLFVFFNGYSNYRTFRYIVKNNSRSDVLVLRFNERAPIWKKIKDELRISCQTPVLVSGFTDTVRPYMILCGIRQFPHFLGSSITRFWPIEPAYHPSLADIQFTQFNTRLSKEQYRAALIRENKRCLHQAPLLLEKSRQAIVPVGHPFPVEWNAWRDIFTTKVVRFPNICDIVHKNEFTISLPSEMTDHLQKDEQGLYRVLKKSGPVTINDRRGDRFLFSLIHDGAVDDVRLFHNGKQTSVSQVSGDGQVTIVAEIGYEDSFHISLDVNRPVKLRAVTWREVDDSPR